MTLAQREIEATIRQLAPGDVMSKGTAGNPNDLVTRRTTLLKWLTARLPELVAGSVVWERKPSRLDPQILMRLRGTAPVWLVDPLDGTRKLRRRRTALARWWSWSRCTLLAAGIYFPEDDSVAGRAGRGAFRNGVRIEPAEPSGEALAGTLYTGQMPDAVALSLATRAAAHRQVRPVNCAAQEYAEIATGRKDYVHFTRLMPWDHAPGALIVRESGGSVRHPDGRQYDVLDARDSLLLAPHDATWQRARQLFGCREGGELDGSTVASAAMQAFPLSYSPQRRGRPYVAPRNLSRSARSSLANCVPTSRAPSRRRGDPSRRQRDAHAAPLPSPTNDSANDCSNRAPVAVSPGALPVRRAIVTCLASASGFSPRP